MSRKSWYALAAVGALGVSALIVGESIAQTFSLSPVNPYNPRLDQVEGSAPPSSVRPPVRDPVRPPPRSPFVP
jgi:hypothetical protein